MIRSVVSKLQKKHVIFVKHANGNTWLKLISTLLKKREINSEATSLLLPLKKKKNLYQLTITLQIKKVNHVKSTYASRHVINENNLFNVFIVYLFI